MGLRLGLKGSYVEGGCVEYLGEKRWEKREYRGNSICWIGKETKGEEITLDSFGRKFRMEMMNEK